MNKIIKNILYKYKQVLFRNDDTISYEEAIKLYDNNKAIIIDVRDEEEYLESHVQGAINVPVYEILEKINKIVKNKDDIIILYCKTGKRSKMAKKILEEEGYNNLYILYIGNI